MVGGSHIALGFSHTMTDINEILRSNSLTKWKREFVPLSKNSITSKTLMRVERSKKLPISKFIVEHMKQPSCRMEEDKCMFGKGCAGVIFSVTSLNMSLFKRAQGSVTTGPMPQAHVEHWITKISFKTLRSGGE